MCNLSLGIREEAMEEAFKLNFRNYVEMVDEGDLALEVALRKLFMTKEEFQAKREELFMISAR